MDGYLIKPIQPETLLDAVERLQLDSGGRPKSAQSKKVILDRAALLDRVDGDMQLLGEVTGLFRQECAPLMARAREAMESGNAGGFAREVHTLRGMFRSLSAVAAQETAGRLEELDLTENREEVQEAYALLERETQAVRAELGALAAETAVPSEPV